MLLLTAATLLAATLTACATNSAPPAASEDPTDAGTTDDTSTTPDDMTAVWLDSRSIVVTVSGDGCMPIVKDVIAEDGVLDVTIAKRETDTTCTEPYIVYPYLVGLPAEIDSSKPLTVNVTSWDDKKGTFELAGLTDGGPASDEININPKPAATWVNDSTIAVLTYGSSSCAPTGGTFSGAGDDLTLVLTESLNKMCTMDYAPRVTLVPADGVDKTATFTLKGFTDEDGNDVVVELRG